MKHVHILAIIAQPAFIEGRSVPCPHCNGAAMVREDGSAFCVAENKAFAPESNDEELFALRQAFDKKHGIDISHRQVMVPGMLASAGFGNSPSGKFSAHA
ncbi:MAG: hypothetical protein JSS83_20880 [Cyanobacteria bacterium SZAS LIN-3]|nr:hypothetical protein [Cyanobacteria bacterium SZAS LIN-3]MBS2010971.1 hypothetical protein [Cyanobacteria bacterium SZAS TMP-1]